MASKKVCEQNYKWDLIQKHWELEVKKKDSLEILGYKQVTVYGR